METNPNEFNILLVWILTAVVNMTAIIIVAVLAFKGGQFSNMEFCRWLPLGPKTLAKQKEIRESKTCSE
jgi:hypothetical protein